jgi:beta-mannosidase
LHCSAIHDRWTFRAGIGPVPPAVVAAGELAATVPGVVHIDLHTAGLIPDPFLDRNEATVGWIGRTEWIYSTVLATGPAMPGERRNLVFDGLDTVATVELDGVVLGQTENQHRGHRFDVTELLGEGDHRLIVRFAAQLDEAERRSLEIGPLPHVNSHPYNAIRKMACNFGWDWGPDLVTAGIWRPVRLETWSVARISAVRPLVAVDGGRGIASVQVRLDRDPAAQNYPLTVSVEVGSAVETVAVQTDEVDIAIQVTVDDVELWWPLGYGSQPLYPVRVVLSVAGGGRLDEWNGRIGFRTVALDTTADDAGTPFRLIVNRRPVFVRGVNWIPDDPFPSRITRERYERRLGQAVDAGVNLIRVWGGGIYEADAFYDSADEKGLMVWQDFLFACACYTEDEPLCSEVLAEAAEAVTRLSPHPSLVVWNGGNENLWGYQDWGWKAEVGTRTWGDGYYRDLLPAVLAELDPTRAYCPGSPFSPHPDVHPNDPAHGTVHIWDVWNQLDHTAYREYWPRFVSEFGFQAPPAFSTLTRAVHDDPLRPDGPDLLSHQKAEDGNDKLVRGLVGHLPAPSNFDDWHWLTSLNQARAITLGVERFRSLAPLCSGTIWWQLNDCWPVVSWAVVDGDERRKPSWYALRASYADRLITIQPGGGGLDVAAVNDSDHPWAGSLRMTRLAWGGQLLTQKTLTVRAAPRSVWRAAVPITLRTPADPSRELIVAELPGAARAFWFFAEDVDRWDNERNSADRPGFRAKVSRVDDGYRVAITAATVLRDLALLADRVHPDAVVDDMLITLLPGESTAVMVQCPVLDDPGVLIRTPVLRYAGDLLRPH